MYHTIQFAAEFTVDIETSARHPLERIRIRAGDRMQAQIRPYVLETEEGLVEMADLYFADGTATRGVRFANFFFAE